ncbi:hypothetical protein ACFW2E_21595, partial [Streptomyces sp. NPDC058964]
AWRRVRDAGAAAPRDRHLAGRPDPAGRRPGDRRLRGHPDNPDLLELTSRVRESSRCFQGPAVRPGAWVDPRVEFGSRSVVWWVNGTRVFADRRGGAGEHDRGRSWGQSA